MHFRPKGPEGSTRPEDMQERTGFLPTSPTKVRDSYNFLVNIFNYNSDIVGIKVNLKIYISSRNIIVVPTIAEYKNYGWGYWLWFGVHSPVGSRLLVSSPERGHVLFLM